MIVKPLVIYSRVLGNINNNVTEIVNTLHKIKGAYLAGGFVRDLWLGKMPKDMDIIVDKSPNKVMDIVDALFAQGLIPNKVLKKLGGPEIKDYVGDGRIKAVYRLENGAFPIEFIQLNSDVDSPHDAIEGFDFNVNQSYADYSHKNEMVCLYINDVTVLNSYMFVKDKRLIHMVEKLADTNISVNDLLWTSYKNAKNRKAVEVKPVDLGVVNGWF